jgi:hypothetical protein
MPVKDNIPSRPRAIGPKSTGKRAPWCQEARDYLTDVYGLEHYSVILKTLAERWGIVVNLRALYGACDRYGIKANRHGVPVRHLARELGVNPWGLNGLIKRRGFTLTGEGKFLFLDPADADKLRAEYAPPPWPALPIAEAAKRLGYTKSGLHCRIRRGQIRAHKCGQATFVCATAVSDILMQRRKEAARAQ